MFSISVFRNPSSGVQKNQLRSINFVLNLITLVFNIAVKNRCHCYTLYPKFFAALSVVLLKMQIFKKQFEVCSCIKVITIDFYSKLPHEMGWFPSVLLRINLQTTKHFRKDWVGQRFELVLTFCDRQVCLFGMNQNLFTGKIVPFVN